MKFDLTTIQCFFRVSFERMLLNNFCGRVKKSKKQLVIDQCEPQCSPCCVLFQDQPDHVPSVLVDLHVGHGVRCFEVRPSRVHHNTGITSELSAKSAR